MPNDALPRDIGPRAMRARFILEAAAGMAARPDEPYREPELTLQIEGGGPVPLEIMCGDTPEAPLGVPLHPAAEAFWTQQGYL